jgi:hypothetical protein
VGFLCVIAARAESDSAKAFSVLVSNNNNCREFEATGGARWVAFCSWLKMCFSNGISNSFDRCLPPENMQNCIIEAQGKLNRRMKKHKTETDKRKEKQN